MKRSMRGLLGIAVAVCAFTVAGSGDLFSNMHMNAMNPESLLGSGQWGRSYSTIQADTGRPAGKLDTTVSPIGEPRRGQVDTTIAPIEMERRRGLEDTVLERRQREEMMREPTLGPGEMQRRVGVDTTPTGRAVMPPTEVRPSMTATLIYESEKARQREANVEVTVRGVTLVDPADVGSQARPGQGHIHYQLDDGPVIATTSTRLSFHGLTSGQHRIMIMLAASDHTPLGPKQVLTVNIP